MNVDERIERRLRNDRRGGVVSDLDIMTPIVHVDEPVGRGPVLERLLDALDPAFAGARPPSVYVHGPKGAGKSAIVETLFDRLDVHAGSQRGAIHTATRTAAPSLPPFVRVDARRANTRFGLYHDILEGLVDEPVPEHGVGTDELSHRLGNVVDGGTVVVAVDHVGESGTFSASTVESRLAEVSSDLVPVCLGRSPLDEISWTPETEVHVPAYERHGLVDIVTARSSGALSREALSHDQVREIAEWADGDVHDALAAIFGAVVEAEDADVGTIRADDISAGIASVPKPCMALGRVVALPENRQRVLYELVRLDDEDRRSVGAATEAVASAAAVDLSAATVRRVLYELAEVGALELVTTSMTNGKGRPPSRIEARFPTRVFTRLFAGH